MAIDRLSCGDLTRLGAIVVAAAGAIMCVKGVMMTAAAVSMASVIAGIVFMMLGAGVCAGGGIGFVFALALP